MRKFLMLGLAPMFFTGCTLTEPVTGRFDDGSATISGTSTGHMDRSGTIALTTSSGLKINGTFVYVTQRSGEGTFTCSDGRSGAFHFVSAGNHGTGTGKLGNQEITFTFGK